MCLVETRVILPDILFVAVAASRPIDDRHLLPTKASRADLSVLT
jgi:hypothetical protein